MKNHAEHRPYPVTDFRFWTAYWIHMRPYLLFVSGIAGFSGFALSPGFTPFSPWVLLAFLPFFMGYGFGQALTDTFQVDTDRLSAGYRPLSRGLITPRAVFIISLSALILCTSIFVYFDRFNLLLAGLSVFGLATYSYFKKHHWYIGPFYNAWIVALLPLMGYYCFASGYELPEALWGAILINFLAYSNFVIMGYLKDISADRATGYRTIPVVWGWSVTVRVGDSLVIAVILGFLWTWSGALLANIPAMILFLAAGLIAVYGQWIAHTVRPRTEENAQLPIVSTVRSFLLWNGAIIVVALPVMFVPMLIYYALFELVLARRPKAAQI